MYLEKLEIQGFKSFAPKTLLEFPKIVSSTKGITAIVGPNGSGKSNIADAIRWVLGEQSLKLLRAKESRDVIFFGTEKKAQLGFAGVSLYLNNEDGQMPVDWSEVVIARRLYRSGEGEYLINKNKVRLQDILMLLAQARFGQRTYSVIGQGMIDTILSVTPQERKDYFDEAAGVREYQIKKEEALRKLKTTRENLSQAEMLLREIGPRARSLTRQVNKLARREKIEKELKELQKHYYGNLWNKITTSYKLQVTSYKEAKGKGDEAKKVIQKIQDKIDVLAKEASREEIFAFLQEQYNEIIEGRNKLFRDQAALKGRMDLEYEKRGKTDLAWLERKREELIKAKEEKIEEKRIFEEAIEEKRNIFGQKIKEKKVVGDKIKEIEKKLEEAKGKNAQKRFKEGLGEIKKEMEDIYKRQCHILEELERVQDLKELSSSKEEMRVLNRRLAHFIEKLESSQKADFLEVLSIEEDLDELLKYKEKLLSEINELKISLGIEEEKINLLNSALGQLEEEKERVEQELGRSKIEPKTKEALEVFRKENKILEEKLAKNEEKLREIKEKMANFNKTEEDKKKKLFSFQGNFQAKQAKFNALIQEVNNIRVELAKIEAKKENLEEEIKEELGDIKLISEHETSTLKTGEEEIEKIRKLKHQLELIGGIDPEVVAEYEEVKKRFSFLKAQSDDLKKAIKSFEQIVSELNETIKKQFNVAFGRINEEFDKYFKVLFNGGSAKLIKIMKEEEPQEETEEKGQQREEEEEEDKKEKEKEKTQRKLILHKSPTPQVLFGIEVQATPPGKRLKNINMLSGGERALTSIALICAIISNNPSPFVVLDEVDASLDEANSIKFANILKDLSQKSQFIVITHNRATMQKADILYGVTMDRDGISKLLSVKLEEAEKSIRQGR